MDMLDMEKLSIDMNYCCTKMYSDSDSKQQQDSYQFGLKTDSNSNFNTTWDSVSKQTKIPTQTWTQGCIQIQPTEGLYGSTRLWLERDKNSKL